jgi:sensor histidine kinase YesM
MRLGISYYMANQVWRKAYLLLCGWFAFSFSLSIGVSYFTTDPYISTIYNGISLYLFLCLLINLIWWWCRLIKGKNIILLVVAHVVGLMLWYFIMGTVYYFFEYYLDNFQTFEEYKEYLFEFLGKDAFQLYYQYFTSVFVFYIVDYTEQIKSKEREKTQLALQNQEMQLSLLKSQINPHFLFNTLNSISVLIGQDKEKARRMINRLSEIFRYALESYDDQQVRLSDEMRFTENYLNIQKVRFEDRLKVVSQVDKDCLNLKVPSMVLQPIVENSVKHGISPKDEGGTIWIKIHKNGEFVYFEVADNGLGSNANKGIKEHGSGVGLSVSDKRLRKMYGEASRLNLEGNQDGFKVKFKIPIK